MIEKFYLPREDSFIMQEVLKQVVKPGMNVLDLGTGSGILAFEAAKIARHIDAVDINPEALSFIKEQIKCLNFNNINVFISNLFDKVNRKYDLIIFNPPYLPEGNNGIKERWLKQAIIGGNEGNEIIEKFLKKAKSYVKENGKILFCFSSLSNKEKIDKTLKEQGYEWELLRKERFWFEDFYVYLAWQKLEIEK